MTTKSEILHEVRDAMVAAERKHGPQMDIPLGCSTIFATVAEGAKNATDTAAQNGTLTWMNIAYEEVMETFAESELAKIRAEALQAAAMFAQIARVCDHQMKQEYGFYVGEKVYVGYCGWGPGKVTEVTPGFVWVDFAGNKSSEPTMCTVQFLTEHNDARAEAL